MKQEKSRKIMFENGTSLTLHDVISYSSNDTTLSLKTKTGEWIIINPTKVLYHSIKYEDES